MISGRIDPFSWRPFLQAYVEIPSLDVRGFVDFLLDTGTDDTVLMPGDARRLKIDYKKIARTDTSIGSAGFTLDRIVRAVVIVPEEDVATYLYEIDLRLPEFDPKKPEMLKPPSLLGRDIMSRWRTTFDGRRSVSIEVLSYDRKMPW